MIQKCDRFAFLYPLLTSLLAGSLYIVATVFTYHPSSGRLTGGSPSTIAWQCLLLLAYSLLSLGHLASPAQSALSTFLFLRFSSCAFFLLVGFQALVSLLAAAFLYSLVVPEPLAGTIALLCALI